MRWVVYVGDTYPEAAYMTLPGPFNRKTNSIHPRRRLPHLLSHYRGNYWRPFFGHYQLHPPLLPADTLLKSDQALLFRNNQLDILSLIHLSHILLFLGEISAICLTDNDPEVFLTHSPSTIGPDCSWYAIRSGTCVAFWHTLKVLVNL
jgi:hypothetical protein